MFRLHYPVTFLAALLCAQPMGLYSPQSQFADTRRHGDKMLPPPAGYPTRPVWMTTTVTVASVISYRTRYLQT